MRDGDGGTDATQLRRTAEEGDALIVAVVRRHGDTVLRIARRHSSCDDDAADASQRAMEIFVRHVRRLDEATAHKWLFRVVRNEAAAVREQRHRHLAPVELHADLLEARHAESPEDRVIGLEAAAQAAEALHALKSSDLQALVMQASGDSYALIAERAGWTGTKVNRVITEGRRRVREQRDAIADGRECERWRPVLAALVDGQATARDLSAVRPHLHNCVACRAHVRGLHRDAAAPAGPRSRVAALAPLGLLGWLARAQDAIVGSLGERVTSRALQLQGAGEALSAGKVAAVAASAAALATGGAAVVDAVPDAGRPGVLRTATAARSVTAAAAPWPAVALRITAPAGSPLRVPGPAVGGPGAVPRGATRAPRARTARRRTEFRGPAGRRPVVAEFVAPTTVSRRAPTLVAAAAARQPAAAPVQAGPTGEFGPAAPAVRPAAAAATATVSPRTAASGGGGEFGP